jgi:hypothetical protein
MKRFLIGFAAMALVIIVSASNAKGERGRRRGYSEVTYAVPATYVVPAYVAPVNVAPGYVVPTYAAAAYVTPVVSTTYTIHTGRRRR